MEPEGKDLGLHLCLTTLGGEVNDYLALLLDYAPPKSGSGAALKIVEPLL